MNNDRLNEQRAREIVKSHNTEDPIGSMETLWEAQTFLAGVEDERAKAKGLVDALEVLYLETADYIRLNHLGDIHHNQSMRAAKEALARYKELK